MSLQWVNLSVYSGGMSKSGSIINLIFYFVFRNCWRKLNLMNPLSLVDWRDSSSTLSDGRLVDELFSGHINSESVNLAILL